MKFKNCFFIVLIMVIFNFSHLYSSNTIKFGAWIVYWDFQRGYEEFRRFGEVFDKVSLFAYEINSKGFPVRTKELNLSKVRAFVKLAKIKKAEPWLTLVNDLRLKSGRILLKEYFSLKRIFKNQKLRKKQIGEIISILKNFGFKGIDLDFERIPEELSEEYGNYISELSLELKKYGLSLNVILEPYKGPVPYWGTTNLTVMAYNLHGKNTLPGPRSTSSLIKKVFKRVEGDARGKPSVAIALKGFLWTKEGKTKRIDFKEAEDIKMNNIENVERDSDSNVPYIKFANGSELWYDDVVSLRKKIITARKSGYQRIMFWYLGGNPVKFFYLLNSFKVKKRGE